MQETGLVKVEDVTVAEFFKEGGSESVLRSYLTKVRSFKYDLTTTKGRQAVKSLAMEPAKAKTLFEKAGKLYADELKKESRAVDEQRKYVRERFDAIRDEARQPLTDWEAKEKAFLAGVKRAKEYCIDFDDAVAFNTLFDMKKDLERREAVQAEKEKKQEEKEAEEQEEKDQKARDKVIADESAAEAKAGEEQAIKDKEQAIKDLKAKAVRIKEQTDRDLKAANVRRINEVKEAREKVEREAQEKEDARIKEKKKVAADKKAREEDLHHRKTINHSILSSLKLCGVAEIDGMKVINSIVKGQIQYLKIIY